jgi:hypothetical protein
MNTATRLTEGKRGCGFRSPGGLYLMGGEPNAPCGKLPMEMAVCPTCSQGVKPARGWTWIRPPGLFGEPSSCRSAGFEVGGPDMQPNYCCSCPAGLGMPERAGLIWVGSQHYETVEKFMAEAREMGISRRLPAIPRGLEIDKTWVFLAHRQAVERPCPTCCPTGTRGDWQTPEWFGADESCEDCGGTGRVHRPGIFTVFQPRRIEKVVTQETTERECAQLRGRGIEPVIVTRAEEAQEGR